MYNPDSFLRFCIELELNSVHKRYKENAWTGNKQAAVFPKFYKPKKAWAVNKNFRTGRNCAGRGEKVFARLENAFGST